jgi:uracil-DNA glycosylase family 4
MAHAHVLGVANGPLDARVLFVAEAVGRRGGAKTGVPLTRDVTGKRFTAFLEIAGIRREDSFITNAVLCNPLDAAGRNRAPAAREVARCGPFLARTLDIVTAPLVVALGRTALESLRAIEDHGAALPCDAVSAVSWRGRRLAAMYHPSVQSTLRRPHARQAEDWRQLGNLLRDLELVSDH